MKLLLHLLTSLHGTQRLCRRSPNMSAVEGRPAVPSGSGNFSVCTADILQLKEMACQSPRSDVAFSQKLVDPLPGKAILSVPKLANRAPFAFVVDSFLVRAANYAVGHRDR